MYEYVDVCAAAEKVVKGLKPAGDVVEEARRR